MSLVEFNSNSSTPAYMPRNRHRDFVRAVRTLECDHRDTSPPQRDAAYRELFEQAARGDLNDGKMITALEAFAYGFQVGDIRPGIFELVRGTAFCYAVRTQVVPSGRAQKRTQSDAKAERERKLAIRRDQDRAARERMRGTRGQKDSGQGKKKGKKG